MAKKTTAAKKSTSKAGAAKSKAAGKAKTARKAAGAKAAAVKTKSPKAKKATAKKPRRLKSPLTKRQLNEFRELLLEKRRTLVGDMDGMQTEALRSSENGASELSSMPFHMADVGTDNYEQEFTLGLLESERQLLREIDEALNRIAESTFGLCMGTGEPIGVPRLKAKPWAKYSIDYTRKIEKGLVRNPATDFGASAYEDELDDEDEAGMEYESDSGEDGYGETSDYGEEE